MQALKPGIKPSKSSPAFTPPRTHRPSQPKPPKKIVTLHMAKMNSPSDALDHFIGPLLDDGAPYCGLSLNELKLISPYLAIS